MTVHAVPEVAQFYKSVVLVEFFAGLQEDGVEHRQLGVVDARKEVVQGVVTEGDAHEEQRSGYFHSAKRFKKIFETSLSLKKNMLISTDIVSTESFNDFVQIL